jgi:hypothetical protein
MAREQTVFSELAVASAINGGTIDEILNIADSDREVYLKELEKRKQSTKGKKLLDALTQSGTAIRNHLLKDGSISRLNIEWTANDKTGSMSTVAKDIHIQNLNLRISVKENANVFINGSAEKIFIQLPSGIFGRSVRGKDWFIETAKKELNEYFLACEGEKFTGNTDVEDFYQSSKKEARKKFGSYVKNLHDTKNIAVLNAYAQLCEKVSNVSADIFNQNLDAYISKQKNISNALQPIFYFFFRINGVKYILAGTEDTHPFAVYMQPGDIWIKKYEFLKILAIPLQSGQPEVLLRFFFKDKLEKREFYLDLKIEIRWSHGKFCGNPEGKVYKKWKYTDLPWSEPIDIL